MAKVRFTIENNIESKDSEVKISYNSLGLSVLPKLFAGLTNICSQYDINVENGECLENEYNGKLYYGTLYTDEIYDYKIAKANGIFVDNHAPNERDRIKLRAMVRAINKTDFPSDLDTDVVDEFMDYYYSGDLTRTATSIAIANLEPCFGARGSRKVARVLDMVKDGTKLEDALRHVRLSDDERDEICEEYYKMFPRRRPKSKSKSKSKAKTK